MTETPMPVEFEIGCVAHHEPLELACLRIQVGQAHQLAFDLFPVGQWIEKEAMVPVDGGHQLTVTTRLHPIPVAGRYRETPLGVESDFGGPTEHGDLLSMVAAVLAGRHPISSHFSPLFDTILRGPGAVNKYPEILVVLQGLRGHSVAKSGQIVAYN